MTICLSKLPLCSSDSAGSFSGWFVKGFLLPTEIQSTYGMLNANKEQGAQFVWHWAHLKYGF